MTEKEKCEKALKDLIEKINDEKDYDRKAELEQDYEMLIDVYINSFVENSNG